MFRLGPELVRGDRTLSLSLLGYQHVQSCLHALHSHSQVSVHFTKPIPFLWISLSFVRPYTYNFIWSQFYMLNIIVTVTFIGLQSWISLVKTNNVGTMGGGTWCNLPPSQHLKSTVNLISEMLMVLEKTEFTLKFFKHILLIIQEVFSFLDI